MNGSALELVTVACLNLCLPVEEMTRIVQRLRSEYVGEIWQLQMMNEDPRMYHGLGISSALQEEIKTLVDRIRNTEDAAVVPELIEGYIDDAIIHVRQMEEEGRDDNA